MNRMNRRWIRDTLNFSFALLALVFWVPKAAHADLPYKLTVILDKINYQAEPRQKNKVENDLKRTFTLFASFRIDGPAGFGNGSELCLVEFEKDPDERDDWDNVTHASWIGLIGDWFRMNAAGGVHNLSLNMAILPNGGSFPCALNQSPSMAGLPPSVLEIAGLSVGGNTITLRQPPLIDDTWMAELLPPYQQKFKLWIDGAEIPGSQVSPALEHDPSKSHMHSSNFVPTETLNHWFVGKEILKATAKWPAF